MTVFARLHGRRVWHTVSDVWRVSGMVSRRTTACGLCLLDSATYLVDPHSDLTPKCRVCERVKGGKVGKGRGHWRITASEVERASEDGGVNE